jgi:hypothetical protein
MTANIYIVPTIPAQQVFTIPLAGVTYTMRLIFCDDPAAGWTLDISDVNGVPIVCGIPLTLGNNLLQQYDYLNFGGALVAVITGNATSVGYTDLGANAQLYFVTTTP